jgi:photosystem II stability/assembly factor-like uncharacterized protein
MSRGGVTGAVAVALAMLGAAAPAFAGVNVWTDLGPNGGEVNALAADPANPQVLYAGTRGGVFKSANGGATWQPASHGLKTFATNALAVDWYQPRTVYAAVGDTTTLESGLAASQDGGSTWGPGPSSNNGYARDGGEEYFTGVAADPARPGTAVGVSDFAVYATHDSGQSWSIAKDFNPINFFYGLGVQVAAAPARGSVFVFASGFFFKDDAPYIKLFETADGGANWADRSAGLPALSTQPALLAIEPTAPGNLYLLQDRKIYRSLDGAASWQQVRTGSRPLIAGPSGLVIAGDGGFGLMQSTDGGSQWQAMAVPNLGHVNAFAFGATPGQLYAAGDAVGVTATDDGGQSWRVANRGLTANRAGAVAVETAGSARIYTSLLAPDGGLQGSGLFRTRDGGAHWRPLAGELGPAARGAELFIDPADSSSLLLTSRTLAARSTDAGSSWTRLSLPGCILPSTLVPAPASPSVLYAAGPCGQRACGASRSDDGGATWGCLGLAGPPGQIVVAPSNPRVVYALYSGEFQVQHHQIWRSADAGRSWTPVDAGLPLSSADFHMPPSLAVDPSDPRRLFVAFPSSLWRSLDGGAHWLERDRGLPLIHPQFGEHFVEAPILAIDPQNPSLIYAGTESVGVYRSLNGGNRWQPILAGLPPLDSFESVTYTSLTPDPNHSGTVYLGTVGRGVLVYSAQ